MRKTTTAPVRRFAAVALMPLLLLAGCSKDPGPEVWVIGLDGADWDRVQPLMEQGRLPHLSGLAADRPDARGGLCSARYRRLDYGEAFVEHAGVDPHHDDRLGKLALTDGAGEGVGDEAAGGGLADAAADGKDGAGPFAAARGGGAAAGEAFHGQPRGRCLNMRRCNTALRVHPNTD